MPRPRPQYLHIERTRGGAVVWYVRRGRGKRVRIRGAYGSPEFMDAYQAAVAAMAPQHAPRAASGSLAWLIDRYRDSGAWAALSEATRRQRARIFKGVVQAEALYPFARITKTAIMAALDRRRATPHMARAFLKALRGLFRWATESGFVKTDPTAGVRWQVPRTEGFHTWTKEEIARFEDRWNVGTRERLALAILLYTGLRRGDCSMLGRQHIRDGVITFRTEKTGSVITIPVLPELAAIIAATPRGNQSKQQTNQAVSQRNSLEGNHLTFIATANGRPMTREGFGNWFRAACRAAGVPGSAHGLRKAGATRMAENGATVAQLNAVFGWRGEAMAGHYTRTADRARLAREAMGKLAK